MQIKSKSTRPRLHVYRSNQYTYAQVISVEGGKIIAAASDKSLKKTKGNKTERARQVGEIIAKQAIDKKVTSVTFDRGYYQYHGRVKAVAEGARKAGLKF